MVARGVTSSGGAAWVAGIYKGVRKGERGGEEGGKMKERDE